MKKIFPTFASVSLLIIAFSVSYYLVVFIPNKEKAKQELEKQKVQLELQKQEEKKKEREEKARKKSSKEILLHSCLERIQNNFSKNWNNACKKLGKEEECELSASWADTFYEALRDGKNDCFKQYPPD